MKKQHCCQALLLLGSVLIAPLHAVHFYKSEEEAQYASDKSCYTHGDLTFILQEQHRVNQEELKKGLLALVQRVKAKEGRKVYFFIGALGSGKSLSIKALQGHKIKKIAQETSDGSDNSLFDNCNSEHKLPLKAQFEFEIVKYALVDDIPIVGDSYTGETRGTYLYYPDLKNQKYQGIAFADTEGFFGCRKATSAEKCLAASSFFYTAKANRVGGLVFVLSAPELETMWREGFNRIAHILEQYFAKAVSEQSMKESFLVMITKVNEKNSSNKVVRKLKRLIQLFYQAYYAETDNKKIFKKRFNRIKKLVGKGASFKKGADEASKKKHKNRYVKLFFEMLLAQDVPKDKINNINNFTLDKKRFCFMFPWDEQCVQNILDKQLSTLKPMASGELFTFDNPVSRYMQASIRCFSFKLNEAIEPLLVLKQKIDSIKKRLERMQNKKGITNDYKVLGSKYKKLTEKWKKERTVQIKKGSATAHMLQFFANEIFKDSDYEEVAKKLLKELKDFSEVTQLRSFTGKASCPKEANGNALHGTSCQLDGDEHQLNDHQSADSEVFDVD